MTLLLFQEVRLVPDGTMFIHIAIILLMIWILNRTFFRPVNSVIASRERSKGGRSSEAQDILKSVGEKQSRIEAAMLEARSRGYELIERQRAEAVAAKQEKIGAVKAEVAQLITQRSQELDKQTLEARNVIEQEAAQMAERISANILK
ncbi:MAG: hypothetical protein ACR2HG_02985 [Pyrinomonadaceae bacterium]